MRSACHPEPSHLPARSSGPPPNLTSPPNLTALGSHLLLSVFLYQWYSLLSHASQVFLLLAIPLISQVIHFSIQKQMGQLSNFYVVEPTGLAHNGNPSSPLIMTEGEARLLYWESCLSISKYGEAHTRGSWIGTTVVVRKSWQSQCTCDTLSYY